MNTYRTIKDKMITKLQAVSTLQEVKTEKTFDFSGFPSAFVIPTEGSGDYETNTEDERIYAFECHIFYQYTVLRLTLALLVIVYLQRFQAALYKGLVAILPVV